MRKSTFIWYLVAYALVLFAGTVLIGENVALRNQIDEAEKARGAADERAQKYEEQYEDALAEIECLKKRNEALVLAYEETSFALGEICHETGWNALGEFDLTYYCPCEKCCGKWADGTTATGTVAAEGRTVAVDPAIIPLGSRVKIDGQVFVAEDTGVRGRKIDVFVADHKKALELGTRQARVSLPAARG